MKEIMDNGPVQGKVMPFCACGPDKYIVINILSCTSKR